MAGERLVSHPALKDKPPGRTVTIFINGKAVEAKEGEILASFLWTKDFFVDRACACEKDRRSIYCGIGHCYQCRVTVDGAEDVRSCLIRIRPEMEVST